MTAFLTPPNDHQIDEILAVMSIDENGHGICASIIPNLGATPLVYGGSSPAVLALFKDKAREIAQATGKTVGIFRFKRDETLWLCDPSGMEAEQ